MGTMRMKVTPTTIAISACTVLLALNLIATTSPAANATANATGPPVPTIVKLLPLSHSYYFRVWSDGRVDTMDGPVGPNCDFTLLVANGPVEHPFPVVDATIAANHANQGIMLTYEDGRVDLLAGTSTDPRCTIAGIGTPSLCTGDTDRDGTVGIVDFLTVLDQWGATCQ